MHTDCDFAVISGRLDETILESPSLPWYMNKNGVYSNKNKNRVYIYAGEGKIPHCHVKFSSKEVCVRLDTAEYFTHGGKQEKFSAIEREIFNKFLHSEEKDQNGVRGSRWAIAVYLWNSFANDNENMESVKIHTCPDYSLLETE